MLGLLLLYFIGKNFYKLAEQYDKSKWGFAILGVASYYGGGIISVFLLILVFPELYHTEDYVLDLIGLPLGLLFCVGLYQILKANFKKNASLSSQDSEDILDTNF